MENNNLPENIKEALFNSRLTFVHPVRFEVFELVEGKILKISDQSFKNQEEAHSYAAKLKNDRPGKYGSITYLPIID